MRENVRRVLRYYYDHPMNTRDRSPWEMMHAALTYEVHSRVLQGGPQGKPVSAVGWLCFNQSCRRMKLMYIDDEGELNVRVGPALQGHRGQLLAILAQGKVSSEYPMLVDGHELKIKDLIKVEMETCYPRTELTFKLIGLMHYLDSETKWVNDQGMQWNMRKLVSEELAQPIRGAACGGTHRLSGLTLAYKTRQARGEPVDGEYAQAQRFVAQHQLYTFRTQNSDGSFSTNWFQGREDENDIDRKLKTTGHMLGMAAVFVDRPRTEEPSHDQGRLFSLEPDVPESLSRLGGRAPGPRTPCAGALRPDDVLEVRYARRLADGDPRHHAFRFAGTR